MLRNSVGCIAVFTLALGAAAQAPAGRGQGQQGGAPAAPARIPPIEERVAGMQKMDGYFPIYW